MRSQHSETGSALVLSLFVLTLLTGMGTALLFLSQHESRMSQAGLREKKAFYLAEAGLEHARRDLFLANGAADFSGLLEAAAGPAVVGEPIDLDPTALAPSFDADGVPIGLTGYDDDVPLVPLTSLDSAEGPGWYAAFLTNDPIEGIADPSDANQRVMLTAAGIGADESFEIVQAIVEPKHLLPPPPPAAITMLGEDPAFYDNGPSGAQSHTGDDCGVPGGDFAPIVGTVGEASKLAVQAGMNNPENFSAGDDPPFTGVDTVGDLTALDDPIVEAAGHGIIDPMWTDCEALKELVIELQARADYYCNTDTSSCTLPATAPDAVVFIDGDLANTPAGSFTGTLVVTGELTYHGNTGWNGVVLVVGEGHVIRSGGGTAGPSGGVIVANIDPTPNGPAASRDDWCTGDDDGFLQASYDTSGGGNSKVQWCTTHLQSANSIQAYRVAQFMQR
jgi:hypothetical protein